MTKLEEKLKTVDKNCQDTFNDTFKIFSMITDRLFTLYRNIQWIFILFLITFAIILLLFLPLIQMTEYKELFISHWEKPFNLIVLIVGGSIPLATLIYLYSATKKNFMQISKLEKKEK